MTSPPAASRGRVRQIGWLAALMVVFAAVVWFQFLKPAGTPAETSNTSTTQAAEPAGGRGAGPAPTPQVVRLKALDAVGELAESNRNPFAFGMRMAPPMAPSRPEGIASAPVVPPSMPPPPTGPPPIGLKLVGMTVVPESGRTMVTLKEPGGNGLYQAFEGDIVDGRYRVVKVGVQSVVVSYVDGTGTRTIAMGG